jgi:hypothetical protein
MLITSSAARAAPLAKSFEAPSDEARALYGERFCSDLSRAGHEIRRQAMGTWLRGRSQATTLCFVAALTLMMWGAPLRAEEGKGADPKPIPGGIARVEGTPVGYHVFVPGPPDETALNEPSTITDFDGVVALADVKGTGMGTDTRSKLKYPMSYELDMRIMKGRYIGTDGQEHQGVFGFL